MISVLYLKGYIFSNFPRGLTFLETVLHECQIPFSGEIKRKYQFVI